MGEEQEKSIHNQMNERKKRRLGRLLLGTVILLSAIGAGAFFFYNMLYRVRPAFSSATYELGDTVSGDVKDYLLGTEWSVDLGQLDISQVDPERSGTYQASVLHGNHEFLYEIIIEDTVAPEISLKQGTVCLAAGREYAPEELIGGVSDADSQVSLSVLKEGLDSGVVRYDDPGSFDCIVTAKDSSGNRSSAVVSVLVDKAPEITGVQDMYLALGCETDFLGQVKAWDESDGDLTDRITLDDSSVQLSREGTYQLIYRVKDDLGIESVSYADVTVTSAEALQEMIGSRAVSRSRDRIVGAANLYDAGASDHDDILETMEYMRPALVQLYHGSETNYSAGSGYIMEITEDTVYICSNRHVVETHDTWDVYFFDGSRVPGVSLGYSDDFDVGVVTVETALLPKEVLDRLMTVHIDKEYWDGLNDQRIDVGLERVDREGGVLHVSTGTLVKVKQHFVWENQKDHTEVTLKLEHGDSGSAILDGYGNLIGMAYAYSSAPRRYWCVPLDGVLECYEEITGRRLYVY